MTYRPRIITPGKLIRTPSGKIARCPGFKFEFSSEDCPCFLDPSPAAWDTDKVYKNKSMVFHAPPAWQDGYYPAHSGVSHAGKIWYSPSARTWGQEPGVQGGWQERQGTWYSTALGSHQGNEPGVAVDFWRPYFHCGNENWNIAPPFHGIGKTPEKYAVSIHVVCDLDERWPDWGEPGCPDGVAIKSQFVYNFYTVFEPSAIVPCSFIKMQYRPTYEYSVEWAGVFGEGSHAGIGDLNDATFGLEFSFGVFCESLGNPTPFFRFEGIMNRGGRPLDCPVPGNIVALWTRYCKYLEDEYASLAGLAVIKTSIGDCAIAANVFVDEKDETLVVDAPGDPCHEKVYAAYHRKLTASWRPLDRDYELWNPEKEYFKDDCVAWLGRFYRACKPPRGGGVILEGDININREPEEDASNTCEFGFFWRLA